MRFAILLLSFILPSLSFAAVWTTTNQWNAKWEQKYQEWVAKNWEKDFYNRKGPYFDLKVDCADVVYTMRYVFAADNGLPFVVEDPSGGKNITNEIKRWDGKPDDVKRRSFLTYLFGILSTRSIPADTYPVAVSRAGISSGSLLLADHASHHSWTIKYVSNTGIPYLIYSSRSRKIKDLYTRYEYPTTSFTFPNGLKAETEAGFRAFRSPEYIGVPVWEVPGYSLDQYNIPIKKWAVTLQQKLKQVDETLNQRVARQLRSICDGANERIDNVNEALEYIVKVNRCFDATEYDDLSTPSRDMRLLGSINDLRATYAEVSNKGLGGDVSNENLYRMAQVIDGDSGDYCPLKISKTKTMTLHELMVAFDKGWVSNNPYDFLETRWGLSNKSSPFAKKCPAY